MGANGGQCRVRTWLCPDSVRPSFADLLSPFAFRCSQSSLLSASQLSQLRTVFSKADRTGAGSLSAAQVASLLRVALGAADGTTNGAAAGISELEVQDLLSEVDVGADGGEGRCDFDEFCHLFSRRFAAPAVQMAAGSDPDAGAAGADGGALSGSASASLLGPAELAELKSAFAALDIDGDALLSPRDLQAAFARIGDEYALQEIEQMVREVDSTNRGRITLADFLAALSPA